MADWQQKYQQLSKVADHLEVGGVTTHYVVY